ncbi:hypothetical protein ACX80Z_11915 [Arthrobacter sp. TMT4-20]
MMNSRMADYVLSNAVAQQGPTPADSESWAPWIAASIFGVFLAVAAIFVTGWISRRHRKESLARSPVEVCPIPEQERDLAASSEWWTRTQWALEASISVDDMRNIYGLKILSVLAKSKDADTKEKAILDAVWQGSCTGMQDDAIDQLIGEARRLKILSEVPKPSPLNGNVKDKPESTPESAKTPLNSYDAERRGEVLSALRHDILAARLKMNLDKELGRATSLRVKLLSELEFPPLGQ